MAGSGRMRAVVLGRSRLLKYSSVLTRGVGERRWKISFGSFLSTATFSVFKHTCLF